MTVFVLFVPYPLFPGTLTFSDNLKKTPVTCEEEIGVRVGMAYIIHKRFNAVATASIQILWTTSMTYANHAVAFMRL